MASIDLLTFLRSLGELWEVKTHDYKKILPSSKLHDFILSYILLENKKRIKGNSSIFKFLFFIDILKKFRLTFIAKTLFWE